MVEPTIATVASGDLGTHSSWNVMRIKVQDTTDGHRHDGVGSFGPLTTFSGGTFTNLSANALFVASTLNTFGPVTVSGNLAAINYSGAGTMAVGGNVSFGGNLVLQSGLTPGVYNAPGNLSGSGIVSQIVVGSNITVSGAAGTGVVAIGVGGTTVFTGTNQSFGTVVQGSTLVRNTLQVSGQTTLAGVILDNASGTGSLFLQSRISAFDAVLTNNLSAGSEFITSTLTVGGAANFSTGMSISNVSANTAVIGSSQINFLTLNSAAQYTNVNTSAGQFRLFNFSAGRVYFALNETNASGVPDVSGLAGWFQFYDVQGTPQTAVQLVPSSGTVNTILSLTSGGAVVAGNVSATGSLQLQSRMVANDAVVTGNFSAGSVYAGSSILLNYSSNVAIITSAQIASLTNISLYNFQNVNTSAGNFRTFTLSAGRAHVTLNAQNAAGTTPDVSGLPGLIQYFDVQSPATIAFQYVTSAGGSAVNIATLASAGLLVTLNVSAGSLVVGSAQATNLSTTTEVVGSSQIGYLTNMSGYRIVTMSTNQSAGIFRAFTLSSGRYYETLNTTNASAIPDVSGNPMLLMYMDNLSGTPAQFVFQIAPSSGTINTQMTLTSGVASFGPFVATAAADSVSVVGAGAGVGLLRRDYTAWSNALAGDKFTFYNLSGIFRLYNNVNDIIQWSSTGAMTIGGKLNLSAGINYAVRTTTASTNTSTADYLVVVQASSVAEAVTLAAAASSLGQAITIYKRSGSGAVTVFANTNEQVAFTGASSITVANETTTRVIGYNNSTWLQI